DQPGQVGQAAFTADLTPLVQVQCVPVFQTGGQDRVLGAGTGQPDADLVPEQHALSGDAGQADDLLLARGQEGGAGQHLRQGLVHGGVGFGNLGQVHFCQQLGPAGLV